ncbi:MAG: ABC transporter substrate-binding protein [Acidimicrobiales bacterium]
MKHARLTKLSGALVGFSLIAAACGGDDGGSTGEATGDTVDANVKQGVEDALTATTDATATTVAAKVPTNITEWEALWKTQRADAVKRITTEGGGLAADGKSTKGSGGFTIDLSKCPAGWSDTEGLTDTEIKIGHTTAQSGTLADYGNIARAIEVMAADINKAGGIKDSKGKTRKVTFIIKDDGYDPARTIPLVDELIDSEKVFAMWTLGSAATLKTYDKLNQRCVPQPLSMTGHPAWGDPLNHPWTTGLQLAYNTEAVLWGAFIEKHIDEMAPNGGKAVIAGLIMNNDFGKAYEAGIKAYLAQSKIKDRLEFVSETIEPSAPTITDPMTTLASKNPAMFIAMTAGTSCTQAIQEVAQNGMKENVKFLFQPSVCVTNSFVGYDKVGDAVDGWYIVNGGQKDLISPAFEADPYVLFARKQLADAGFDYKTSGSFGSGYTFGWPIFQALQIASDLPGGLTRSNLVLAIRAMDMTHPILLEGIKFNMNGTKDAYMIEGGVFQKRDAKGDKWVSEGSIIDLSGKSANCVWDVSVSTCK